MKQLWFLSSVITASLWVHAEECDSILQQNLPLKDTILQISKLPGENSLVCFNSLYLSLNLDTLPSEVLKPNSANSSLNTVRDEEEYETVEQEQESLEQEQETVTQEQETVDFFSILNQDLLAWDSGSPVPFPSPYLLEASKNIQPAAGYLTFSEQSKKESLPRILVLLQAFIQNKTPPLHPSANTLTTSQPLYSLRLMDTFSFQYSSIIQGYENSIQTVSLQFPKVQQKRRTGIMNLLYLQFIGNEDEESKKRLRQQMEEQNRVFQEGPHIQETPLSTTKMHIDFPLYTLCKKTLDSKFQPIQAEIASISWQGFLSQNADILPLVDAWLSFQNNSYFFSHLFPAQRIIRAPIIMLNTDDIPPSFLSASPEELQSLVHFLQELKYYHFLNLLIYQASHCISNTFQESLLLSYNEPISTPADQQAQPTENKPLGNILPTDPAHSQTEPTADILPFFTLHYELKETLTHPTTQTIPIKRISMDYWINQSSDQHPLDENNPAQEINKLLNQLLFHSEESSP